MSRIVDFYEGTSTGPSNQTIDDIWAYDASKLELRHDFIQWLFPLREASRYNPDAPLLVPGDEAAFAAEPRLRERLGRSLDLMLAFYGLERHADEIRPRAGAESTRAAWMQPWDHNHLRLSRIVQSLALLGLAEDGRRLRACLLELLAQQPEAFAPETAAIWQTLPG